MKMKSIHVLNLGKTIQHTKNGVYTFKMILIHIFIFNMYRQDVMLCVSNKLICDGIRHCPVGTEYDSDEDADMCLRHKVMLESVSFSYSKKKNILQNVIRKYIF